MSAISASAFPKTGESNAGLPITVWIAALCLFAVFNTYVAAIANRADADPAMPFVAGLRLMAFGYMSLTHMSVNHIR